MSELSPSKLKLSNSEFITAISHYYRAEMSRANIWRSRLDVTTNWAIVTTAAFLSFGFGSPHIPHFVILLATLFVLFFLIMEARRYKFFDLWRWRVVLLNENFFATVISPEMEPLQQNWRELLSKELQHSQFKITLVEAFGRRLRRNYSWIFLVLAICWVTKIIIHPTRATHFSDILERAEIINILPAWFVLSTVVIFNGALLLIALLTAKQREEVVRIYPVGKGYQDPTN